MRRFIAIDIKHSMALFYKLPDCRCFIGVNNVVADPNKKLVVFDLKSVVSCYTNVLWLDGPNIVKSIQELDTKQHNALPVLKPNFILDILASHKQVGFLTDYNNIIYSIHSKTVRSNIKTITFQYLSGQTSLDSTLKELADFMPNKGKSANSAVQIKELLQSEAAANLRSAYAEYTKNKLALKDIVKSYSVNTYDIYYIESTLKKSEKH